MPGRNMTILEVRKMTDNCYI